MLVSLLTHVMINHKSIKLNIVSQHSCLMPQWNTRPGEYKIVAYTILTDHAYWYITGARIHRMARGAELMQCLGLSRVPNCGGSTTVVRCGGRKRQRCSKAAC